MPWVGWRAYRLVGALHPYLFRQVTRSQLATVVFASKVWMDQGIAPGVPSESARVIYYGVPIGPLLPRSALRHRLLWVARLSPEKGLHIVLPALPSVIHWYRAEIERLLDRLNLRGAVDLVPAVPRETLPAYYADHDLLLSSSQDAEQVALVTMEAFAAGIPVVSSRPRTDSPLIQDGVTSLTYDPSRTDSVASGICRMLGDESLRRLLARQAHDVAVLTFSPEAMGRQYDECLRGLLLR